jgi:hypothetical protein
MPRWAQRRVRFDRDYGLHGLWAVFGGFAARHADARAICAEVETADFDRRSVEAVNRLRDATYGRYLARSGDREAPVLLHSPDLEALYAHVAQVRVNAMVSWRFRWTAESSTQQKLVVRYVQGKDDAIVSVRFDFRWTDADPLDTAAAWGRVVGLEPALV